MTPPLSYDAHQFAGRRAMPVHSWHEGGELKSTGIDYSDYRTSMSIQDHKASGERKKPTPLWVRDKGKFQLVLAEMMDRRVLLNYGQHRHLPPEERLELARRRWAEMRPGLIERAKKLSREYLNLKNANGDPQRQRRLAIQIESLDTMLRVADWPAMIAAVCYLYWGAMFDSVGVSAELGIRPPTVRQITSRCDRIASELFRPDPQPTLQRKPRRPRPPRMCRLCGNRILTNRRRYCTVICAATAVRDNAREREKNWPPRPTLYCRLCGKEIPPGAGRRSYCSEECQRNVNTGGIRASSAQGLA